MQLDNFLNEKVEEKLGFNVKEIRFKLSSKNKIEIYKQKQDSKNQTKKLTIDKYPLKFYFYGLIYMKFNYNFRDKSTFFGVTRNFVNSYKYFRNIIDIYTFFGFIIIF